MGLQRQCLVTKRNVVHSEKADVAAKLLKMYESTASPQFRRQCLKMITELTNRADQKQVNFDCSQIKQTRTKSATTPPLKRICAASELVEKSDLCHALSLDEEWRNRTAYQTSYQRQFPIGSTYHPKQLGQPISGYLLEEPLQPSKKSNCVKSAHDKVNNDGGSSKMISRKSLPHIQMQALSRYGEEFFDRGFSKAVPQRSASGSGMRRNNPQAHPDFLKWQHSKQRGKQVQSRSAFDSIPAVNDIVVYRAKIGSQTERKLTNQSNKPEKTINHPGTRPQTARNLVKIDDKKVENAIKHKTRSIYQVDYLGAPQGVNLRTAFFDVTDLNITGEKPNPPLTLDTNSRISYQKPKILPTGLRPDTSRYGCNSNFFVPAIGVVPLLSEGDVDMNSLGDRGARTTYSREFNAKRPFTAPGTRFGSRPDVQSYPQISTSNKGENLEELNKEDIFKRARSARVNESLTYRKTILRPTVVNIREPFSQWPGPE